MKKSKWLKKDFNRPIYEHEKELFTKFVEVLENECPEQVNPSDIFLTGEGPRILILIIPHKCLDGVSLVIWHDKYEVSFMWSQLGNLHGHEALEEGVVTNYVEKREGWSKEFSECLKCELNRLIIVKCKYWFNSTTKYYFKYYIEHNGYDCIGGTKKGFSFFRRSTPSKTEEFKTSLNSSTNLPFYLKPYIYYG